MEQLILLLAILLVVGFGLLAYIMLRALNRPRGIEASPLPPAALAAQYPLLAAKLVQPVDPKSTCATCEHFDLEAGQARYRRQPVFAQLVAPFIPPSEYDAKIVEVKANADGILENASEVKPNANVPETCNWSRFGLCLKHNNCLWEGTTAENRLQNMADLTPGGVDCYKLKLKVI